MSVPVLRLRPGQEDLIRRVIERLKTGKVGDFILPWSQGVFDGRPRNAITGRPYGGYNCFATTVSGFFQNFDSPLWLTRKQIESHGGHLVPGADAHPTHIIFTGRYRRKLPGVEANGADTQPLPLGDRPEAPPPPAPVPAPAAQESPAAAKLPESARAAAPSGVQEEWGRFVREFEVFNLRQTTGVRLPKRMQQHLDDRAQRMATWTPDDGLREIRRALTEAKVAPIFFDQEYKCFYQKGSHEIHAPREGYFNSELDMWECIAHETIHATGHESLLNRPTLTHLLGKDSPEYHLEELTAVMGSLFISQETGVDITPERERNWSAYLQGYNALAILEQNPSVFVQALVRADFAARFVLHPDLRPDFIKNRKTPDQVEFSFLEFEHSGSPTQPPVDVQDSDAILQETRQLADALAKSPGAELVHAGR